MLERRGDLELSSDPSRLDRVRVFRFLSEQSYWAAGVSRDIVERALDNSLCFGIYGPEGQIAFARVISDCATFAYLADVFVLPDYRGRGLGKWLIDAILRHDDLQGLRRWLLATRDAHGIYAQFGFAPLANPSRILERHDADVYSRHRLTQDP
jgi:GNAT superfamily N-acetyltransferase